MLSLRQALGSSVGKKFILALSGIALVGFLVLHLAGNVLLYLPGGEAFNLYTENMTSNRAFLLVAEVGLATVFLAHIITAIRTKLTSKSARPIGYSATGSKVSKTKGGPSHSGLSSVYMILSGVLVLSFLILHVLQFRLGPGVSEGYSVAGPDGKPIRDMYRVVVETFQDPIWVGVYVAAMLAIGLHLRHGFWSAFQSLGLMNSRWSGTIYGLALLIALVLAGGFLFIPLWFFFFGGGA